MICDNDLHHSSVVYISVSVELRTIIVCRFEDQCKGLPNHIMNLDSDFYLNSSGKTSGECNLGIDAP